jgi:hypothetical protein
MSQCDNRFLGKKTAENISFESSSLPLCLHLSFADPFSQW